MYIIIVVCIISSWIVSPVLARPKLEGESCDGITEIPLTECQVLLELYIDFDLGKRDFPNEWFVTNTPSYWGGLVVRDGHVVILGMWGIEADGVIPININQLTHLEILDLGGSRVFGTIPDSVWTITSLKEIDLKNNYLSGTLSLPDEPFPSLEILNLSNNFFASLIPPEIGNLTNLKELYLINNAFFGTIPPQIGNLVSLTILDMGHNQLSGSIPPELGNLTNLTNLLLRNNQLSGEISPELGKLTNLINLELGDNRLSGFIPSAISNLTNLEKLLLWNNQLSGEIPEEIWSLPRLYELYLNGNFLTGTISTDIGKLSYLQTLLLSNNLLTGSIPKEIGSLSWLYYLKLNNNLLSGSIPIEIGNLGINDSSTPIIINLENNRLTGSIPSTIGNISPLWRINLSGNQLSGDVPESLSSLMHVSDPGQMWDGSDGLSMDYNQLNVPDPYPSDPPTALQTFLLQKDPDWQFTQSVVKPISNTGGTLSARDDRVEIVFPANSVSASITMQYIPKRSPEFSTGSLFFANTSFELNALDELGDPIPQFDFETPITITMNYSDSDILGVVGNTLKLYYWDASQELWLDAATSCSPTSTYQRDLISNSISIDICHLTEFALLGEEPYVGYVFLPMLLR